MEYHYDQLESLVDNLAVKDGIMHWNPTTQNTALELLEEARNHVEDLGCKVQIEDFLKKNSPTRIIEVTLSVEYKDVPDHIDVGTALRHSIRRCIENANLLSTHRGNLAVRDWELDVKELDQS